MKKLLLLLLLPWAIQAQEVKLSIRFLDNKGKPLANTKVLVTEIETREEIKANTDAGGNVNFHIKSGKVWQISTKAIHRHPMWQVRIPEVGVSEQQRTITYDLDDYRWHLEQPLDRNSPSVKIIQQTGNVNAGECAAKLELRRPSNGEPVANMLVKVVCKKNESIYVAKTDAAGNAVFSLPNGHIYDIDIEGVERISYMVIPSNTGNYARKLPFEPINFTERMEGDTVRQVLPSVPTPTTTRHLTVVRYLLGNALLANTEVHLKSETGKVYLAKTDAQGKAFYMLPKGYVYYYIMGQPGLLEESKEVVDLRLVQGIGSSNRMVRIDPDFVPRSTKLKLAYAKTFEHLNKLFEKNGVTVTAFERKGMPEYVRNLLIYEDPDHAIDIKEGLLLTTGTVFNAIGPNDSPSMSRQHSNFAIDGIPAALKPVTSHSSSEEEDVMAEASNFDVCWVEMEVTPAKSKLVFEYVFASEEYPEYLEFDDAFGIFVEGQGFDGQQNYALLPGSSTHTSIGGVNALKNAAFYWENNNPGKPSYGTWQYDGFTKKLRSEIAVVPGSKYRIKLIILDRRDGIFDTAAFFSMHSE